MTKSSADTVPTLETQEHSDQNLTTKRQSAAILFWHYKFHLKIHWGAERRL